MADSKLGDGGPFPRPSPEPGDLGNVSNSNVRFRPIADIRVRRHPLKMSELLCIVCPHVFARERPVRVLIHHYDGSWQAVCGERDHREDCGDFHPVGLNHIIDRQSDMRQFEGLRTSTIAEYTTDGWQVSRFDE
jgi:hypothetical protein